MLCKPQGRAEGGIVVDRVVWRVGGGANGLRKIAQGVRGLALWVGDFAEKLVEADVSLQSGTVAKVLLQLLLLCFHLQQHGRDRHGVRQCSVK